MRSFRFWAMAVLAIAVLGWFLYDDPNGGLQLKEQLRSLVGLIVAAPLVYYLRRFFAEARSLKAVEVAIKDPVGAGLVFIGLCILTGLLFISVSNRAVAASLPGDAARDLPILRQEIAARWQVMPMPSMLAAQVEQESGWKAKATLHTSREDGAGYGQFTRAYRADGALRFDAVADVAKLDASLAGWNWQDRYNPRMQLRAVVVKNRECYAHMRPLAADNYNALAMCDAAYNGGLGGVYAERRMCGQVAGCNPGVWFAHVELYSTKSRAKWKGYGASAFEINRTHVRNVMVVRRPKYVPILGA